MKFGRGTPIPPDVTTALLAVGSSRNYIWDEALEKVRPAGPDESDLLPKFTELEMSEMRRDFVDGHREQTYKPDRKALEEWQAGRLATRMLRPPLKAAWSKFQASKVALRLEQYFQISQEKIDVPTPLSDDIPPAHDERPTDGGPITALSVSAEAPITFSESREADDDQLAAERRDAGDTLGVGEALARKLAYVENSRVDNVLARIVATWACPLRLDQEFESTNDLALRSHEFVSEDLAVAFVHAYARLRAASRSLPNIATDLVFRLAEPIAVTFGTSSRLAPLQLATQAVAHLESALAVLRDATAAFYSANVLTAKAASIDVIKAARNFLTIALPSERPILAIIDRLLGPVFRKFCEGCERNDDADVVRRVPELREQLAGAVAGEAHDHSPLWREFIHPVFRHVEVLLDEGLRRSEIAASPFLCLANSAVKLDLTSNVSQTFSCRLLNRGEGRALEVVGSGKESLPGVTTDIIEPNGSFEVGGRSEQFVTFRVTLSQIRERLEIPLTWKCRTPVGASRDFDDILVIEQQHHEPDWEKLRDSPPYTTKPIQHRDQLFGREHVLEDLLLHVGAGTSTFLWGQKRVGKTSVLQVLASELNCRPNCFCLTLRMGYIAYMHEGQIAYSIAHALNEMAGSPLVVPPEADFGASMGRLVPFIERLVRSRTGNYTVVIDEFDDLDPAFYMGERGRLFIKALRSLSEVGLTFFFVGTERMASIYRRHQEDLNKWLDMSLSRIESVEDCTELITRPVFDAIEYDREAVRRIIQYCSGNPFYMQVFCFEIFKRCFQGRSTFVSESDVMAVGNSLVHSLGETNFAHFWLDNPELDHEQRRRQAAENCLVLVCLTRLSGSYENVEELHEVQEELGLSYGEQLSVAGIREVIERLRRRGVLTVHEGKSGVKIELPIFRDWLKEHAELLLLRQWREFCSRLTVEDKTAPLVRVIEDRTFPVSEDELLAVSQRLVYCGRQKDVAEVRAWLRQFDDDSRIEIAFLLLKRLAEKGYINEGERVFAINRLQEAVQTLGEGQPRKVWRIVRGRRENLCISYVDSDTKSGASTARDVAKLLRPGKCAAISEVGNWLRDHTGQDAVLLIVDDFAGTGRTVVNGLEGFLEQRGNESLLRRFSDKGAIHLFLLFAFPDAIQAIQKRFPNLQTTAIRTFGEEVRGLDPESGIFTDEAELRFAHDVLVQIGRQLTPQTPVGHGDMATLVGFHNTIPNNSLPIFWSNGIVNEKLWNPLFPRASWN
jgi:hypothetical protein